MWAPNAKEIHVVGDFNQWKGNLHALKRITNEGLWVGFYTDIPENIPYKYEIVSENGQVLLKADPYALQSELRPETASLTPILSEYEWNDNDWQEEKKTFDVYTSPVSIYEVHLGSWKTNETVNFIHIANLLIN